jgi:hypothetical protein
MLLNDGMRLTEDILVKLINAKEKSLEKKDQVLVKRLLLRLTRRTKIERLSVARRDKERNCQNIISGSRTNTRA